MVEVSLSENSITIQFKDASWKNLYNASFFNVFGIEHANEQIKTKEGEIPLQKFTDYLATASKRQNTVATFYASGLDYISLNNIVNDLTSCLNYFKSKGYRLIEKKREDIYVINGRFLFLSEALLDARFHQEEEQHILNLISEICGKKYTRDEPLFLEIKGTMLHKSLSDLQ